MEMQIVSVPLFNKDMAVEAYLFRYQKGNDFFSTTQATNVFDGATQSLPLETLNLVGLDAITLGKQIFVPINYLMLLGDLAAQCRQPPDKIIFMFEESPKPEEPYISKMAGLRKLGFRFAVGGIGNPQAYDPILQHCSFFFLSQRPKDIEDSTRVLAVLRKHYRGLTPVAAQVHSEEMLKKLYGQGYTYYESRFYKVPVTQGEHKVSPLKANLLRLINIVQDENFEFEHVSAIVQGDPALTISLMRMVNSPHLGMRNKIKTIQHAVAMLGQQEVRKWVTTAVSQKLGDDRPNELTKISLVRAKFAENLAPLFEMTHMAQGIFLMGLFSVLDVILEVHMEAAIRMLMVSDVIRDALVSSTGIFYPVLNMITSYENADWSAVSRLMIIHDIEQNDLSNAYLEALIWYKNLIIQDEEFLEEDEESAKALK